MKWIICVLIYISIGILWTVNDFREPRLNRPGYTRLSFGERVTHAFFTVFTWLPFIIYLFISNSRITESFWGKDGTLDTVFRETIDHLKIKKRKKDPFRELQKEIDKIRK